MLSRFSIPKRNLVNSFIIFLLSVSVVVFANLARQSVSAEEAATSAGPDRYENLLLNGTDFKTECEKANPRDTLYDALRDEVNVVIDKYNETVNCLFNVRIAELVALGNTGNKEDLDMLLQLLSPPTGAIIGREKCVGVGEKRNLSTYCLAQSALDEYLAFRKALFFARKQAKNKAIHRYEELGAKPGQNVVEQRLIKPVQSYGEQINRIDRELEIAKKALDQGLAAYNELQMALPLHVKYKAVIETLVEYRDKVAAIRREVDLYPETFLDVSTTACT